MSNTSINLSGTSSQDLLMIAKAIETDGFVHRQADQTQQILAHYGFGEWEAFKRSWNDLGIDRYMADGGAYRRRRYAVYSLRDDDIQRKQHQPHYQSRDFNILNGGVERWFRPISDEIGRHPIMLALLRAFLDLATLLTTEKTRPTSWHAEVHQFRIETLADMEGRPSPEGLHRDGVDWVWVVMIDRENVAFGETSVHDLTKNEIGSFMLKSPLDAAIVDDHRVYHGVTPIKALDPTKPGHRDVLVITLRRE